MKEEDYLWLRTKRGVYCLAFSHSRLAFVREKTGEMLNFHPCGGTTTCGVLFCSRKTSVVRKVLRQAPRYEFQEVYSAAVCSIEDRFDRERGERLALARALRKLWPNSREERKAVFELWGTEGSERRYD